MKNIKIIRFSESLRDEWDFFIACSNSGTIFQTRRFLNYHPPDRFKDCSLLFMEGDKIIAVVPAILKTEGKNLTFSSHAGSSYGGIIHKKDLSLKDACMIVELLLKHAKLLRCSKIQMTQTPIIYHDVPSNSIEFALHKNGFCLKKRELTAAVRLQPQKNIDDIFKPTARTAVRKAMKNKITIKDSNNFEEFYSILKKNLKSKHNVAPTHTLTELLELKKLFPKDIFLKAAYLNEKLIAGVVNFICNERVMLAFYISQDNNYQSYRPLNLLFREIMSDCRQKKYYFYDFGLFTVNMEPNWGLARFKESLGGTCIFRDCYER